MCLMIAAGQTLFSCMSGTAFAKYSFPLKKFWFILFHLLELYGLLSFSRQSQILHLMPQEWMA